jgi:hypothetical protein
MMDRDINELVPPLPPLPPKDAASVWPKKYWCIEPKSAHFSASLLLTLQSFSEE